MIDFIIIFVLVFLNGYFSLAEVALISARRPRLRADAKNGNNNARLALALMDKPDTFISTAQIGITVVSILTGVYTSSALADDFALIIEGWGVPHGMSHVVSQVSILAVATYIQVELGEVFPKRLALSKSESMARFTALPMTIFAWFCKPFIWMMTVNTDVLMRIMRIKDDDNRVTEEEVRSVIQEGTDSGEVQPVEQNIMERALVLGDLRVGAIMTHRSDLVSLDASATSEEVSATLAGSIHSVYPVTDDGTTDDKLLGYVTLKDLIPVLHSSNFSLRRIVRKPLYFPESMTVYLALEKLKSAHESRALVCDEYGSLQGIISYKDIFEGLVGALPASSELPDIIERADKSSWVVSGQSLFYDFLAYYGKEELHTQEYKTVGGLLLGQLGHIPHVGEVITWECFRLRVISMVGNRIDKVLVRLSEAAPSSSPTDSESK